MGSLASSRKTREAARVLFLRTAPLGPHIGRVEERVSAACPGHFSEATRDGFFTPTLRRQPRCPAAEPMLIR